MMPLKAELRSLESSLVRAGENRSELEKALETLPSWEMEFLIQSARQYDLVNLTSEQLVENIVYARKVRNLPYLDGKLDEEIWKNWVLPYRVLEEDLCLWRKAFYEQLHGTLKDERTTKEVAESVLKWLWETNEAGEPRIKVSGGSGGENRNKSPVQILATGRETCRGMNLLNVYLLRSVGIPARHCIFPWWSHREGRHFYCEYWDAQLNQWVSWDSSDNMVLMSRTPRERFEEGRWSSLAMYALPGFSPERDIYGTSNWAACDRVTSNIASVSTHSLAVVEAGSVVSVRAYVWNGGTWRIFFEGKGEKDQMQLELAVTTTTPRPILLSSTDGSTWSWSIGIPRSEDDPIQFLHVEIGEGLDWSISNQSGNRGGLEK